MSKKNQFEMICIVAMSENNIIGNGHGMPWKIPNDLKRLKKITMGCPLIMGRKTLDTLPKKLEGRVSIVLTKKMNFNSNHALQSNGILDAIEKAKKWLLIKNKNEKRIFLFGGGEIYRQGLKYCNEIEMTLVKKKVKGNVFFPDINMNDWDKIILNEIESVDESPSFLYQKFIRKNKVYL